MQTASLAKARQVLGATKTAPVRPPVNLDEPPRYGERITPGCGDSRARGARGPAASRRSRRGTAAAGGRSRPRGRPGGARCRRGGADLPAARSRTRHRARLGVRRKVTDDDAPRVSPSRASSLRRRRPAPPASTAPPCAACAPRRRLHRLCPRRRLRCRCPLRRPNRLLRHTLPPRRPRDIRRRDTPPPGTPAPGYPAPAYPAPRSTGSCRAARVCPAGVPRTWLSVADVSRSRSPRAVPPCGRAGTRSAPLWALGFLVLIPFPFIGGLASGLRDGCQRGIGASNRRTRCGERAVGLELGTDLPDGVDGAPRHALRAAHHRDLSGQRLHRVLPAGHPHHVVLRRLAAARRARDHRARCGCLREASCASPFAIPFARA